ncbi:FxsA family protein [Aeromonas dhakensis]|uniref:FxsA family protein n=1 Tax=Aeromonas dhakensis TaxID=196024 RepID=UPI00029AF406|nr:FxsA family protein [Aeromonas dhakensis]AHV36433.1 FxsA protein [Aeromonas hydrophila YL17]WAF77768.1 FxsA family protein [Aeromonas dhakensis]BEJ50878.1 FxsA family protein [Aeromonas dhakensis]HDZ8911115.1 FxsA family protein [Aeromonas dhakensis]
MGKLFLLLVGLVVLELTVMIEVGSVIGALPTVGLLILTAVLGSSLVRSEGIKTLFNAQQKMQQGEMPGREVMGGMMLALAGLLLIIPGFVTDFFGILLLQPWLRNKLADKLIGSNQFRMQMGGFQSRQQTFDEVPGSDQPGQSQRAGTTIEGEFERKE